MLGRSEPTSSSRREARTLKRRHTYRARTYQSSCPLLDRGSVAERAQEVCRMAAGRLERLLEEDPHRSRDSEEFQVGVRH